MMEPGRFRFLIICAAFALSALTSGCLSTIDDGCQGVAETHCARCFGCAEGIDDISGGELCDLPAGANATRTSCERVLEEQCGRQARAIQDPFPDIEDCQDALDKDSCTALVDRYALDQPDPPMACMRFL